MQRTILALFLPLLFLFVLAGPAYSRGSAFEESELPRITEEQSGIAQYPIGLSSNDD